MSLANLGIAGRNLLPYRSGYGASVVARLSSRSFGLIAGATIDWNTVTALGSDLILPDEELLRSGWRAIRYGQIMTRVTKASGSSITITGSPTGGTYTISASTTLNPTENSISGTETTTAISLTTTALQVQAALEALMVVGVGNVTVTGAAGGPYYLTFSPSLGTVTVTTTSSLTGGTSPAATVAAGAGGIPRSFGPFDPTATDGRAVLTRGDVFIMNRTRVMGGSLQLPLQDDMHLGECVVGGDVWGASIVATSGTHSLAAGPTWTELLAVMPSLVPIYV